MKLWNFIALTIVVAQCHCLVVHYESEKIDSKIAVCNIPVLMMTIEDAPSAGESPTYEFDLTFDVDASDDNISNSFVESLAVNIFQSNGKKQLDSTMCAQVPSDLIISEKFSSKEELQKGFKQSYNVTQSGYYILSISNNLERPITYSGKATWRNPFGHLSGDIYGFLPFYRVMAIILFVSTIVWAGVNFVYRKDLLRLQHYLTATLIVCLIEFTSWFSYYSQFNETGVPNTAGLGWALLVTVCLRTVSRMLVVAVSMGLGVVKANLERETNIKILVAGGVYFIAEGIDELVLHYGHLKEVDRFTRMILIAPPTFLDAIFYWWIFTSLASTLETLQEANQFSKLKSYRNFSRILAVSLFAATIMAIYTMYWVTIGIQMPKMWPQRWFIESGFWQGLYVLVLLSALVLWRPVAHQKDLAGAFQLPTTEEDELALNPNDLEDFTDDQLEAEVNEVDMFSIDGDEDIDTGAPLHGKGISSM